MLNVDIDGFVFENYCGELAPDAEVFIDY